MTNSTMVRMKTIGISRSRMPSGSAEGAINPGIASTPRVLNRFEPTTLPIAMSCSFLSAPVIDAASSGKLVPIAMTVRPKLLPGLTETVFDISVRRMVV